MHDWFEWLSGVIVPGVVGLGAVVVGFASLRVARASNRLTKELAARDAERRDRQARIEFGERVRRYAELLRTERLTGTAAPNLELAEETARIGNAAVMSSLPGTTTLVNAVTQAMRSEWSTGDVMGAMLLAMSQVHALIDIWVDEPLEFIESQRRQD